MVAGLCPSMVVGYILNHSCLHTDWSLQLRLWKAMSQFFLVPRHWLVHEQEGCENSGIKNGQELLKLVDREPFSEVHKV